MTDATAHRPDSLDRPDIIVFPPIIPLSTLIISCVLQWLVPLGLLDDIDQAWRIGWARSCSRRACSRRSSPGAR